MSGARTVAGTLAEWITALDPADIPDAVARACADTVIDTVGLGIAARRTDYVAALRAAWTTPGACTAWGFAEPVDAVSAAMINGTAAHGEDFDNTFEGCPVHAGAVAVPAVLAVAEQFALSGRQALKGLAVASELMCRLGLVAQKGVHAAGFHPTAVLGAMAATGGVAAAAALPTVATARAFGIAGSMASGIIEYLADGSWTKRMHAGWAAHSGIHAALMAKHGFTGPGTVFEGTHGLLHGFAPSVDADFSLLTHDLGKVWHTERTAFKPYACGTMTQPFIDCARRLAQRVAADEIEALVCFVGEGTMHRLWEPLALKQKPPNAYAAKFSTPYCVAVGFLRDDAGLAEFTEESVRDPAILELASRVRYEIDPNDEYPRNYTGRILATLKDGRTLEELQPHLRGGSRDPLTREELLKKCAANIAYGRLDPALATAIADFGDGLRSSNAAVSLLQLVGRADQ